MRYRVFTIPPFDRQIKRLIKKYPSLKVEYSRLIYSLEVNPFQGIALANSCYKIRLATKSKGKGKSGGARVITHIHIIENSVYLLAIYDKSDLINISDKELKYLLSFIIKSG